MAIPGFAMAGEVTSSAVVPEKHKNPLIIKKATLVELEEYGYTSPNREVCGLLTGTKGLDKWEVNKFHPITNISNDDVGYDDYKMDPQEAMEILWKSDRIPNGIHEYDLVATFHTHPHSTPYPSSIDIKYAAYNVTYIIYSVVMDKFSFNFWNGDWFVPIDVEVV